jgi:biotin synthase
MDVIELYQKVAATGFIRREEAKILIDADIYDMMYGANRIRQRNKGNVVEFCSIVNARSGRCTNDCSFCAQSSSWKTKIKTFPLLAERTMATRIAQAAATNTGHVGIVTSGPAIKKKEEVDRICRVIKQASKGNDFSMCASLGELNLPTARRLKKAGLKCYHHNLETSENFYSQVCSTIDYKKKIQTIENAIDAGLEVCCGGVFGLGESWEDRLDLAFTIRQLDPHSVPLNFLRPIKGTPLEKQPMLEPLEALRIISLFRYIMPDKTIKVCGGREDILRDMQSWMFYAGADGAMLGDYLTIKGRNPKADLKMVKDLGLECKTS